MVLVTTKAFVFSLNQNVWSFCSSKKIFLAFGCFVNGCQEQLLSGLVRGHSQLIAPRYDKQEQELYLPM